MNSSGIWIVAVAGIPVAVKVAEAPVVEVVAVTEPTLPLAIACDTPSKTISTLPIAISTHLAVTSVSVGRTSAVMPVGDKVHVLTILIKVKVKVRVFFFGIKGVVTVDINLGVVSGVLESKTKIL